MDEGGAVQAQGLPKTGTAIWVVSVTVTGFAVLMVRSLVVSLLREPPHPECIISLRLPNVTAARCSNNSRLLSMPPESARE